MLPETRDQLAALNDPMAGWRPTTWLLAAAASALMTVATAAAVIVVFLEYAGTCGDPTPHLVAGRLWTAGVVVATALAGALVAHRSAYPLRVACFAVVPLVVPLLALVVALTSSASEWGWCLA